MRGFLPFVFGLFAGCALMWCSVDAGKPDMPKGSKVTICHKSENQTTIDQFVIYHIAPGEQPMTPAPEGAVQWQIATGEEPNQKVYFLYRIEPAANPR
jgi:hypothetical protein